MRIGTRSSPGSQTTRFGGGPSPTRISDSRANDLMIAAQASSIRTPETPALSLQKFATFRRELAIPDLPGGFRVFSFRHETLAYSCGSPALAAVPVIGRALPSQGSRHSLRAKVRPMSANPSPYLTALTEFDISEVNKSIRADSKKGMVPRIIYFGVFLLVLQGAVIGATLILNGLPGLLAHFGLLEWIYGVPGAALVVLFRQRQAPGPRSIEVGPEQLILIWEDGKRVRYPWSRPGYRMRLADASWLEAGREHIPEYNWYLIRLPHSPITYPMTREAYAEVLRVAQDCGRDVRHSMGGAIAYPFVEIVDIVTPRKGVRIYE
jgi:hypothetical protein